MASPSSCACALSCPVLSWSGFHLRFAPGCGRGFDSCRLHLPLEQRDSEIHGGNDSLFDLESAENVSELVEIPVPSARPPPPFRNLSTRPSALAAERGPWSGGTRRCGTPSTPVFYLRQRCADVLGWSSGRELNDRAVLRPDDVHAPGCEDQAGATRIVLEEGVQ
jgi:hypothetical protein